jgi:hypothetical protein
MNRIFPPSLPEWHSAVVGFGSGFAFGAADTDSDVARAFVRAVLVNDDDTGHLAQAEDEAAYATACFVLGAVVGSAWSGRRND